MAKLQDPLFLRNSKGQSVVEYILLLAVLSSIGFAVLNNKKFLAFIKGDKGLFAQMRLGMEYSYRYGRSIDSSTNPSDAMDFSYENNKHDTYYNQVENRSRFFSGLDPYGQNGN